MNTMNTMINELKNIGIKFDNDNVKQCLLRHQIKQRTRELISVAKKIDLDIKSDNVKVSIAAVVINYDDIIKSEPLEIELVKTMSLQDPIFTKTIKKTDEFKELLYLVGDAVDRRTYNNGVN